MTEPLSFGIIGTGGIASDFATALAKSKRCRVVSVVGSSPEKARGFADKFRIPAAAASLDEFVKDPKVQAVYVATPHPSHEAHARAALEAGRAVLCEKPLALDAASVERLVQTARSRGAFLMEAFMYRSHPLLARVLDVLRGGAIGAPLHLKSVFGFRTPREPGARVGPTGVGGGA
jgi:predicted dehydrogenase